MEDAKLKMEEVKSKAKAFMKNFNSPFGARGSTGSSSSQVFRGQGHRLGGGGGAESSANGTPSCSVARRLGQGFYDQRQQQSDVRKLQQEKWERERGVPPDHPSGCGQVDNRARGCGTPKHVIQSGGTVSSAAASVRSSTPDDRLRVEREPRGTVQVGNLAQTNSHWNERDVPSSFDPYSPLIASGTSHRPTVTGEFRPAKAQGQFQCPICHQWWHSEAQVSAHIDDCTGVGEAELANLAIRQDGSRRENGPRQPAEAYSSDDLEESVAIFLSGAPSKATIDVTLKIFRNITTSPKDEKFRKIRLSRLKETVASAVGGPQFFESFGFQIVPEGGEKFFFMGQPSIEQYNRLQAAILYLESHESKKSEAPSSMRSQQATAVTNDFDRKLRIFYSRNDSREERLEVPDSFYNLSAAEVKNEAAARRKKIEDSQLLIPKSFREKQAANARKRYSVTVLRIQLPDGLVVECSFQPVEPTTTLYEFVGSLLKDSHATFDLVLPAAVKHRIIPRFPNSSGHCLTLEEADLVPKALLKLTPTGEEGYTCLKNEYYALCEPLK